MELTNSDIVELTAFRRRLHQRPEVSGNEAETARLVWTEVSALTPDRILTGPAGMESRLYSTAAEADQR